MALDFENEESAGTRRFFSLIGPWTDILDNGYTAFVDEIETSLHPILVKELLKILLCSKNNPKGAQVVFTTHNPVLLDGALMRRDKIWFTEKSPAGATHLYPLTDYQTRKDEALGKGYLAGRYGAIPFMPEGLKLRAVSVHSPEVQRPTAEGNLNSNHQESLSSSLRGEKTEPNYTVANSVGGSDSVTRTVVVNDSTPPVFLSISNLVIDFDTEAGAVLSYAPTAQDLCSGNLTASSNPPRGSILPIGTNTVSCTATVYSGNGTMPICVQVVKTILNAGFLAPVDGHCQWNCQQNGGWNRHPPLTGNHPAETRPRHLNASRRFCCMIQTHAHENQIHPVPAR